MSVGSDAAARASNSVNSFLVSMLTARFLTGGAGAGAAAGACSKTRKSDDTDALNFIPVLVHTAGGVCDPAPAALELHELVS